MDTGPRRQQWKPWHKWTLGAIGVLLVLIMIVAIIDGGGTDADADADQAQDTTTEATAASTQSATTPKPATGEPTRPSESQQRTKEFRETWWVPGGELPWMAYFKRVEGVFGGWLYIETNLHPDNPDTDEIASEICSAGLGYGNTADTAIDGFRGVSVYGVGAAKVKECKVGEVVR